MGSEMKIYEKFGVFNETYKVSKMKRIKFSLKRFESLMKEHGSPIKKWCLHLNVSLSYKIWEVFDQVYFYYIKEEYIVTSNQYKFVIQHLLCTFTVYRDEKTYRHPLIRTNNKTIIKIVLPMGNLDQVIYFLDLIFKLNIHRFPQFHFLIKYRGRYVPLYVYPLGSCHGTGPRGKSRCTWKLLEGEEVRQRYYIF